MSWKQERKDESNNRQADEQLAIGFLGNISEEKAKEITNIAVIQMKNEWNQRFLREVCETVDLTRNITL